MKVAVLLNGNLRTIDKCSENILRTFEHLNPDYFVSTYKNQYGYHPHIKDYLNYKEDPILEDSVIIEKFSNINPKYIFIEDVSIINQYYSQEVGKFHPNMQAFESSFLQYLKLKKGLGLIQNYENENNFKYDAIIKTRCDIMHNSISHIDLSDLYRKVIVSTGNVFPNDCVIITERDNMISIVDFIIDEFYHMRNNGSSANAPHGVLLSGIMNRNLTVEQYHIMDYVVRATMNQYY